MATPASLQAATGSSEYDSAMSRAGRFLTLKARTEHEVRDKLTGAGFDSEVVDRVLDRLIEMKLVDDVDFARSWVKERMRKKGSGPQVLVAELETKGIDRVVIDEIVGAAFPDESLRAREVAAGLLPKWSGLPLEKQASRLAGALARKGFSSEAVQDGLKAVLPPEGWD
ncbi:MAG TPA: regulatory protein RecX [Actinomycetota bacterium]|nr:regulatory protein RecX [Actinomycetota bacterium]